MNQQKLTAILGASKNPTRYAFIAAERLNNAGYPIKLLSIKKGELFGYSFLNLREKPLIDDLHTITLYIGTQNLHEWEDYIFNLQPKRIIFNPGTEHQDIATKAKALNIEVVYGCTLVMLSTGQF